MINQVSPSEDTFENQFLSLDSIHSLHSYLSNELLSKIEIPEYKLEIDQLSLSAQLTGRLVPVRVSRFERDYSLVDLPLRYLGVSDRIKCSTSLIHDVCTDREGNIYALDRGNTQVNNNNNNNIQNSSLITFVYLFTICLPLCLLVCLLV